MALDDYVESEVAIAVAATAALVSPKVRGVLRQGAVYGLAGVLLAGDAVGAVVRGVGRGVQQAATSAADAGTAAATPEDAAERRAAQRDAGEQTPRRGRRTREEAGGE